MKRFRIALCALLLAIPVSVAAQGLPPHAPGTICVTPKGWCWPTQSGTPGSGCTCALGNSSVSGTYN